MKKLYLLILLATILSCNEEEPIKLPQVETASTDAIFNTSAKVGGRVVTDGGAEITEHGVYWGTLPGTDTTGTKLQIGQGLGIFYDTLQNLTSGTKYYVKAYATNMTGTTFGAETNFTTQISLPTITTLPINDITPTTAKITGNITNNGGFEITARGIYWGINQNVLNSGVQINAGKGSGQFTVLIENLDRGVTYYALTYATNIKGTTYGQTIGFTTEPQLPVVETTDAVNITVYSAYIGGQLKNTGGSAITETGIYLGTNTQPQTTGTKIIIPTTTQSFMDSVETLTPNTTYYYIAYATNNIGTAYGTEKTFTTTGQKPAAQTLYAYNIGRTQASLSGIVSANGLSTTVIFEYGTTTQYGKTSGPQNGNVTNNNDTVFTELSGLTENTIYHFRIKAENELGVVYGNDTTFTTVLDGYTGTLTDADGNNYKTIGIGNQVWMAENLKTTKFNDNTEITLVQNDSVWEQLTDAAFCWYNNNIDYKDTYGALYNWHTVNTGKLCPAGWHVPTATDFEKLTDYLGGSNYAGGLLKSKSIEHWLLPNTGATNQYGFNAIAGGLRDNNAVYDFMKINANWWSSSNYSTHTASYFYILYNYGNSFQNYINKNFALSVRCVKD